MEIQGFKLPRVFSKGLGPLSFGSEVWGLELASLRTNRAKLQCTAGGLRRLSGPTFVGQVLSGATQPLPLRTRTPPKKVEGLGFKVWEFGV